MAKHATVQGPIPRAVCLCGFPGVRPDLASLSLVESSLRVELRFTARLFFGESIELSCQEFFGSDRFGFLLAPVGPNRADGFRCSSAGLR